MGRDKERGIQDVKDGSWIIVDSSWVIGNGEWHPTTSNLKVHHMAFRFEELKIWHLSMDLSNDIDLLARTFPIEEKFSLSTQIKRAADSVVLNIAEGSTGQTRPVFKNFLNIALRSAIEVVAALFLARKRMYIQEDQFRPLYNEYDILCRIITKLRSSI